jgi:PleD family two-component response regulator
MGKKILVIHEDEKNVGLFGKAMEPKGFDVYAIGTPDKGIEKAIEIEPDLIFVDLIFQDSNGLKVSSFYILSIS